MKPILFNTAMVRAILDGRKTVTRRVIKPQPNENADMRYCFAGGRKDDVGKWHDWQQGVMDAPKWTPPCHADDILYVRETWGYDKNNWLYKADFTPADLDRIASITRWHPSIHMPKEAARIFLRVTKVWVERLHDMTATSAMDEGFTDWMDFVKTWDSTIPKHPNIFKSYPYYWKDNPWVWVIKFERISREEAYHEQ